MRHRLGLSGGGLSMRMRMRSRSAIGRLLGLSRWQIMHFSSVAFLVYSRH